MHLISSALPAIYLEQLTYLIFLKMADEYAKPPYSRDVGIPEKYSWPILKAKRGAELEGHYIELLRELGKRKDVLGQIFTKAQNKIQDPAKLYRLIDMIDEVQALRVSLDLRDGRYWLILDPDIWIWPSRARRAAEEFMDKRRGDRFNKKYNQLLDAWVPLVVGTNARNTEIIVSAFASGCAAENPSFSFGTRTAFSQTLTFDITRCSRSCREA